MLKTKRIPIILFSTIITLSLIYGISTDKILKGSAATFPTSANHESDADLVPLSPVSATQELSPQPEGSIEISTKISEEIAVIKYTIKSGDTLESIAKSHGVKVSTIAASSGISTNSILNEGQVLQFPSVDGVLYKIKSGDTLWELAKEYNLDVNNIIEINNLEHNSRISIGQQIILPGALKLKTSAATSQTKTSVSSVKGASTLASAAWPTRGTISSQFGQRWGKLHTGLDIAAPKGSDVYASMDGKVTFSGWKGSYGYLVIIDHGSGLETYYGHNSKNVVKIGAQVKKGSVIAKVGSTGNSTGPHSHFEVRVNGTPVNPFV